MTSRENLIQDFLNTLGWSKAIRKPLAVDASNRSYDRLNQSNGERAVLMNAPRHNNSAVSIFHDIANRLLDAGLSAPQIIATDEDAGLMLIEDLGDDLFARIADNSTEIEDTMYSRAIDVLCTLHRDGNCAGLAPYDLATYQREAALLTQWYLPNVASASFDEAAYLRLVSEACSKLQGSPVLVQRDYHAENLIWLPERSGVAQVGLLDFQDALAGHPAYDLVSLLEDARRDTSSKLQSKMKLRYCAQMQLDVTEFDQAYAILGAQRNFKIIGIFSRLCIRDGKQHYVDLIPRVWAHLQTDLAHPALADLRQWVDQNVPAPTADMLAKLWGKKFDG